jgi:ERCC4 domain-containing protein
MAKSIRKRRTLITSPLTWQMRADPVPPPMIPVMAERGGTQLKTPRPVLVVDTREQVPLDFSRFEGWFAGIERKALKLGDYSIAGMEDICVVERKDLSDLVHSCTTDRYIFVNRLRRMAKYAHRLLLVTSTLSQIKSPYSHPSSNPNRIAQSLIAILAGLQIPFLCSETHKLGEEIVASYLYQVHLYHWLETNDFGRFLIDNRHLGAWVENGPRHLKAFQRSRKFLRMTPLSQVIFWWRLQKHT